MGSFNDSGLQKTLGEMLARATHSEKPRTEIGFAMEQEMKMNIAQGGRPNEWKPSIRVQNKGGQTLRDTGALMNSMTSELVGEDGVAAGAGSAVAYKARILALGGVIKAKTKPFLRFRIPGGGWVSKKEVTIPARDYTYIPDQSWLTFGEIMKNHLLGTS